MSPASMPVVPLSEMVPEQEADLFVLMTHKEQLTTRDGKPYFKVGFRDAGREVNFPIWANSPLAIDCRDQWAPGKFYKVRAVYRESNFGPQLDIRKIREAVEADATSEQELADVEEDEAEEEPGDVEAEAEDVVEEAEEAEEEAEEVEEEVEEAEEEVEEVEEEVEEVVDEPAEEADEDDAPTEEVSDGDDAEEKEKES